jgi:hypothetical protein
MKRPVGVILSGILQILGGLLFLLFSISMLLMPLIMRRAPGPPTTPAPSGLFAGLAAFYGVFAIMGLLTAIGLFRLKRWSRYSTLVFAGVLVATGLFLALAFALTPISDTWFSERNGRRAKHSPGEGRYGCDFACERRLGGHLAVLLQPS